MRESLPPAAAGLSAMSIVSSRCSSECARIRPDSSGAGKLAPVLRWPKDPRQITELRITCAKYSENRVFDRRNPRWSGERLHCSNALKRKFATLADQWNNNGNFHRNNDFEQP